MKSRARAAWLGLVAAALAALILLGGCQNRAAKKVEAPEAQSKQSPAQITVENGQTFITLDAATQKRLGFTVATLTSSVTRAQETFPAVVVSVQELATFRNTYVAAQAQLQKARIEAGVADKEYARLKALAGPEQNVSEKSLQAAEAALQLDEADVHAAEQQLNLQASALRQEWGGVVTQWATENSAQLQHMFERGQALVAMTMPAGTTFAAPRSISLELPGGTRIAGTFVSEYPKVDPRIQGRSVLYLTSSKSELPPGLNLAAHLPVGGLLKGVVIPASAVVWSEDKAWVYAQVSPERFSRSPVPTDVPVEGGFFAGQGIAAGDKIVTVGAQALLSEEMLLHSQGGGDEE
jgi:multidrug efflux system membrane fusion protein